MTPSELLNGVRTILENNYPGWTVYPGNSEALQHRGIQLALIGATSTPFRGYAVGINENLSVILSYRVGTDEFVSYGEVLDYRNQIFATLTEALPDLNPDELELFTNGGNAELNPAEKAVMDRGELTYWVTGFQIPLLIKT